MSEGNQGPTPPGPAPRNGQAPGEVEQELAASRTAAGSQVARNSQPSSSATPPRVRPTGPPMAPRPAPSQPSTPRQASIPPPTSNALQGGGPQGSNAPQGNNAPQGSNPAPGAPSGSNGSSAWSSENGAPGYPDGRPEMTPPVGQPAALPEPTVPVWAPPPPAAPKQSWRERLGLVKKDESGSAGPNGSQQTNLRQNSPNGTAPKAEAVPARLQDLSAPAPASTAAVPIPAAKVAAVQAPAGPLYRTADPARPGVDPAAQPTDLRQSGPLPGGPNPTAPVPTGLVPIGPTPANPDSGPPTQTLPAIAPAAAVVAARAPSDRVGAAPRAGTARRTRKARLRLSRLDPWSVMKTSFLFSIAAGIMLVVAVYVVWTVIGSSGLFESINGVVNIVLSTPGDTTPFRVQDYVSTQKVLGVAALLACVDVVIFTALATLGSFLYNLAATMLGGLEITLAED